MRKIYSIRINSLQDDSTNYTKVLYDIFQTEDEATKKHLAANKEINEKKCKLPI